MATIRRQEITDALARLGQLAEARGARIELALVAFADLWEDRDGDA